MDSLRSPRSYSLPAAFTLLELLAVIGIISILMSLLFPVLATVKEAARRAEATQHIEGIVTAVKAYHTEYGKYPSVKAGATPAGDEGVGDTANAAMPAHNSVLFDTLRGIDRGVNTGYATNPRRITFFEGKAVVNVDQPRSGFVDKGSGETRGSLFDPWGTQYNVIMDTDYDNRVAVTQYYSDIQKEDSPQAGVVAFSLGRDGKLGAGGNKKAHDKNSDDVLSWE